MIPTINDVGSATADMTSAIAETIRSVSAKARDAAITPDSLLLDDLALDSLDLVAVVIQLQDQFQVEIDPDDVTNIRTVGELADSLHRHMRSAA